MGYGSDLRLKIIRSFRKEATRRANVDNEQSQGVKPPSERVGSIPGYLNGPDSRRVAS